MPICNTAGTMSGMPAHSHRTRAVLSAGPIPQRTTNRAGSMRRLTSYDVIASVHGTAMAHTHQRDPPRSTTAAAMPLMSVRTMV